MNSPTLSACPFCGGVNIVQCNFRMTCWACGCDGPDADEGGIGPAIAAWNRRAALAALSAPAVQPDADSGHSTRASGVCASAPSRENADNVSPGSDVHDESVSAPETRSALIQFAADVIRLRTNGEPLKVRESETLDSRLCDLGMAMRAEADRITAAIRGAVAAPVAAQPDLTALLREARSTIDTLCTGLEWNIENHPDVMNDSDSEALGEARDTLAAIDAMLPRSEKGQG